MCVNNKDLIIEKNVKKLKLHWLITHAFDFLMNSGCSRQSERPNVTFSFQRYRKQLFSVYYSEQQKVLGGKFMNASLNK